MKKAVVRSDLMLLGASVIWGLAFVAQKVGARYVPAFTFNGVRFLLGGLSLLPLILMMHRREAWGRRWEAYRRALAPGLLTGCVLFAAATLQQLGVTTVAAGEAAFITDTYIVMVPLVGLLLHQRVHPIIWPSILLSLGGLYLIGVSGTLTISRGVWYEIIGAVFWSGHILIVDRFSPRTDPLMFSQIQFFTCGVLSLLTGLLVEHVRPGALLLAAWPILYGGLLSVGVAYTLQVVGQRVASPAHAAIILSMESFFATLGGLAILREDLGLRGYLGCLLMVSGMTLSQLPQFFRQSSADKGNGGKDMENISKF